MNQVVTLCHPLVDCHLTRLRDTLTTPADFRHSIGQLSQLLAFRATEDLQTDEFSIQTPIQTTAGKKLQASIGIVPILRAGIAMVDPVLNLIPSSEVWHLGMYRDEQTAQPVPYYNKLPAQAPVDVALIVDPMLATGGSAVMAVNEVRAWGVSTIKLLSIIAAPEGVQAVNRSCPEVEVFTCALDKELNENKFIVPGLGDAGDRIFNTQR